MYLYRMHQQRRNVLLYILGKKKTCCFFADTRCCQVILGSSSSVLVRYSCGRAVTLLCVLRHSRRPEQTYKDVWRHKKPFISSAKKNQDDNRPGPKKINGDALLAWVFPCTPDSSLKPTDPFPPWTRTWPETSNARVQWCRGLALPDQFLRFLIAV